MEWTKKRDPKRLVMYENGWRCEYNDIYTRMYPSLKDIDCHAQDAADAGDITAMKVYELCGEYLGRGLSILIDILNPQKIVIGSIFARRRDLLWEAAKRVIENEALSPAAAVCEVVPAELGENIGDFGAIATALL